MTCCKKVILFNISGGMKSLRAMAARLLRPLLMVERLPLNTPAMKSPGTPGRSPATCSTCRGSIWSRVLTWTLTLGHGQITHGHLLGGDGVTVPVHRVHHHAQPARHQHQAVGDDEVVFYRSLSLLQRG